MTSSMSLICTQIKSLVPVLGEWAEKSNPNYTDQVETGLRKVRESMDDFVFLFAGRQDNLPTECGPSGNIIRGMVHAISCIRETIDSIFDSYIHHDASRSRESLTVLVMQSDEIPASESNAEGDLSVTTNQPSTVSYSSISSSSSCTTTTVHRLVASCSAISANGTIIGTATASCVTATQVTSACEGIHGRTKTGGVLNSTSALDTAPPTPVFCGGRQCGQSCDSENIPSSGIINFNSLPGFAAITPGIPVSTQTSIATTDVPFAKRDEFFHSYALENPEDLAFGGNIERFVGTMSNRALNLPHKFSSNINIGGQATFEANMFTIGVQGLYGCSATVVLSSHGVFISHHYEVGGFASVETNAIYPLEEFHQKVAVPLVQHLLELTTAPDTNFDPSGSVRVYVVTPFTDEYLGSVYDIHTPFFYQSQAEHLLSQMSSLFTSIEVAEIIGYWRYQGLSEALDSSAGKVLIQYTPLQTFELLKQVNSEGALISQCQTQVARVQLWVTSTLVGPIDWPATSRQLISFDPGNRKRQDTQTVGQCEIINQTTSEPKKTTALGHIPTSFETLWLSTNGSEYVPSTADDEPARSSVRAPNSAASQPKTGTKSKTSTQRKTSTRSGLSSKGQPSSVRVGAFSLISFQNNADKALKGNTKGRGSHCHDHRSALVVNFEQ